VVMVSLQALELNLPDTKGKKNQFLSMVIKRGEQQRFESDRIYNVPFLKKDVKNYKTDMLMNKTNYVQLAKMHNAAGSLNMEDMENDPDFFE